MNPVAKIAALTSVQDTLFLDTYGIVNRFDITHSTVKFSIKTAFNIRGSITHNTSCILSKYIPSYSASVYEWLTAKHNCVYTVSSDSHCMGCGFNSKLKEYNGILLGGSSSGSAYSLLADASLSYSICSDTAGSLVLPCVQTSLWGFKPSKGQISRYGLHEYCPQLDRVAIMGRNLNILEEVYRLINVFDERDPYCAYAVQPLDTPLDIYVEDKTLCALFPSAKKCNIDWNLLTKLARPYLATYAYSACARFDGVRFNPQIRRAERDLTVKTEYRNKLLTATVKRRIIQGAKTLYEGAFETLPTLDRLVEFEGDVGIIILKHTRLYSESAIIETEFRYGLANFINYCSLVIPLKAYSIELLAPAGYERYLFEFAKHVS